MRKTTGQLRAEIIDVVDAAMLIAIDGVVERGSVDVHVLSKADLLKFGRKDIQLCIKDLTSEDLQKYCAALAIPHVSDPCSCESMKVAILTAVPNERVSREALLSDGVSALRARLRDATLEHHATRSKHQLLREQQPGLLRDCAESMGVPLKQIKCARVRNKYVLLSSKLWRRTSPTL